MNSPRYWIEENELGVCIVSKRGRVALMIAGYAQTQKEDARAIMSALNDQEGRRAV